MTHDLRSRSGDRGVRSGVRRVDVICPPSTFSNNPALLLGPSRPCEPDWFIGPAISAAEDSSLVNLSVGANLSAWWDFAEWEV